MKQISDKRLIFLNPLEIIPPEEGEVCEDRYRLFLLSESIRENGLLIPITVYKTKYGYSVISGERRVKASIIAGLERIPCIVVSSFKDRLLFKTAEEKVVIESDPFKKAEELKKLCLKYSLSKVAADLSLTTGEVSKIIAITNLPQELKAKARAENLSLFQIIKLYELKQEECSDYFKNIIYSSPFCSKKEANKPPDDKKLPPIKDARFLINSVKQLSESVNNAGIPIKYRQKETDSAIEIKIRIEKNSITNQMSLF